MRKHAFFSNPSPPHSRSRLHAPLPVALAACSLRGPRRQQPSLLCGFHKKHKKRGASALRPWVGAALVGAAFVGVALWPRRLALWVHDNQVGHAAQVVEPNLLGLCVQRAEVQGVLRVLRHALGHQAEPELGVLALLVQVVQVDVRDLVGRGDAAAHVVLLAVEHHHLAVVQHEVLVLVHAEAARALALKNTADAAPHDHDASPELSSLEGGRHAGHDGEPAELASEVLRRVVLGLLHLGAGALEGARRAVTRILIGLGHRCCNAVLGRALRRPSTGARVLEQRCTRGAESRAGGSPRQPRDTEGAEARRPCHTKTASTRAPRTRGSRTVPLTSSGGALATERLESRLGWLSRRSPEASGEHPATRGPHKELSRRQLRVQKGG
mmetsp:Transcript_38750/g.107657  ORF Transcript_38750/g.107657 Transcript_38750/m.107657 type:complete len:383 (+) Transcript_38750:136-1284(+)